MGRRLPWFIAKGKAELFRKVKLATSGRLQTLLAFLPVPLRTSVVGNLEGLRARLVEILTVKLGYLDHAPYVAFGAWYSIYDQDLDGAKTFLCSCVAEHDTAVQAGKSHMLHRITPRLCVAGTLVRVDIDAFLAGTEPLHRYPHLFLALLEYALIPAVERRIEAVHARIKFVGQRAYGAGVPFVCAAIRSARHLDMLKASADFATFACSQWHSRTLADKVLRLRYNPGELKGKSLDQQLKKIYQTGIDQEFADTLAARTNVAHFRQDTADMRMALPRPPETVWQSCLLLKTILDRGCFISLPHDLIHLCRLAPGGQPPIPPESRPADVAVETALVSLPEIQFSSQTSSLFQVINNSCEGRVIVQCHHIALDRRFHVTIQLWKPVDRTDDHPNKVVAQMEAGENILTLDIRPLVLHIGRVLAEGARWLVHKSTVDPSYRILPLALCDASPSMSSLVPIEAAPAETIQAMVPAERRFTLADEEEQSIVLRVLTNSQAYVLSGRTVAVTDETLQDVSEVTVNALVQLGAVKAQQEEGALRLSLVPSAIEWKLTHGLAYPLPLGRVTTPRSLMQKSKVELGIALCSDNWVAQTGRLAPHAPAGPRVFSRGWTKPVAYFACLCAAENLFTKGIPDIRHVAPSSYYRCLMLLEGDALHSMLLALEDMQDVDFRRLLRDMQCGPDDDDPVPIEDLPEGFPAAPDAIVPCLSLPVPPPMDLWPRCLARSPGFEDMKIYFDHGTSGGKSQKGYAVCSRCGICRWKNCNSADTREIYCATMVAWQRACAAVGGRPVDHRLYMPPDAHVADALDGLTLEDCWKTNNHNPCHDIKFPHTNNPIIEFQF